MKAVSKIISDFRQLLDMKLGTSNIMFSWSANSVVNIPILFAMIGMIFSILLLGNDGGQVSYHEVYFQNKKTLVKDVIKSRIDRLTHLTDSLSAYRYIPSEKPADSLKIRNAAFQKAERALTNSQLELYNIDNANVDTLGYYARYISINRDTLYAAINVMQENEKKNFTRDIIITLKDTCTALSVSPIFKTAVLTLSQNKKSDLMTFFNDYSIFGFWFFFSIAQMTLWFLLIPLIIGAVKQTDTIQTLPYNALAGLLFAILPTLLVIVFAYLFYNHLIDAYVIKDTFFMENYNSKMIWYSIPGYIVAILCFSSYLFLSNKLELLDINVTSSTNLADEYKKLTSTFEFTFLCSAIVLSVFVFWIGILFNAINNTEAMRFYSLLSGKPFLNYDFVYLLGLMHTLLLFIFYIPARIRFNNLSITQDQKSLAASEAPVSAKFWSGLLDVLSTILLTTSPLLTTILQKILSSFSS